MILFIRLLNQNFGLITFQIIIFLLLFITAKPSLSQVGCGRYPTIVFVDKRTMKKSSTCLWSVKYNRNGAIYKIGDWRTEIDTLYKGKDGDAIFEYFNATGRQRIYGEWKQVSQEYIFRFPGGIYYIPK
jgi:hypothetical protein